MLWAGAGSLDSRVATVRAPTDDEVAPLEDLLKCASRANGTLPSFAALAWANRIRWTPADDPAAVTFAVVTVFELHRRFLAVGAERSFHGPKRVARTVADVKISTATTATCRPPRSLRPNPYRAATYSSCSGPRRLAAASLGRRRSSSTFGGLAVDAEARLPTKEERAHPDGHDATMRFGFASFGGPFETLSEPTNEFQHG